MTEKQKQEQQYDGYEVGPIRPPSEAMSLMIRITRNCPWNQCRFCSLYKGEKFRVRPTEHVCKDIEIIKGFIDAFRMVDRGMAAESSRIVDELRKDGLPGMEWAYHAALNWYRSGMESIFLQDANSLVIKPANMIEILSFMRKSFPDVKRITSYARSHTIARISDEDLKEIADAGLNRIHIGMETGCDEVLDLVRKGVHKDDHIAAGQKIKRTSIELSEYFMPGLGGNEFSRENAVETADALNQINPDYIRIRTLAIPENTLLHEDYQKGVFTRTNDVQMVQELYWLIEKLDGITSMVKSDHILNLLPEVEGQLPEDKEKMMAVMQWFLSLEPNEQMIFRIGRRTGIMNDTGDLSNDARRSRVTQIIQQNQISLENVDQVTDELIKRFI